MTIKKSKRERHVSDVLLSLAKILGWSLQEVLTLGERPRLWSGYESRGASDRRELEEQIRQEIYYLLRKEYLVRKSDGSLGLTEAGLKKATLLLGKKRKKMKKGNYLIVVFDIPEKYKKGRDNFRYFLVENSFQKLQESVWLSSDEIYDELLEYINEANLGEWINIFIVEKLAFIPDKVKQRLKL